jgi:excisionase family DNA binding protein
VKAHISGTNHRSAATVRRIAPAPVAFAGKLNQQTVYNWIDRGRLPALHAGRRVRIRRADFDAMVKAGYSGPPPPPSAPPQTIWDGVIGAPIMPDE